MIKVLPPLVGINDRTFVIDSCDYVVATVLAEHGWKQIHKNSVSWNLKWTWKAENKVFQTLQSRQFINHFQGSDEISTKLGLSLLFKRTPIIMDSGKSYVTFYPRSYNLNTEKQEFITDFIQTGILNLLKKIRVCLQLYHPSLYQETLKKKKKFRESDCQKLLKQVLFSSSHDLADQSTIKNNFSLNGKLTLRLLFYLQNLFSLQHRYTFQPNQLLQLLHYSQQDVPFSFPPQTSQQQITPSTDLLCLILMYHEKCMKNIPSFYQDGFSNIWVVKSNHSSRGRNIVLIEDLGEIGAVDNGMKLVQKYVENIWVLHQLGDGGRERHPGLEKIVNRKFDIRLWVLVRSFNPLTVYIYKQAYLRISSQSYRLDSLHNIKSHLTNFSLNWKKSPECHSSSYLLFSQFLKYLQQEQGVNTAQIVQKIDRIILETLRLVEIGGTGGSGGSGTGSDSRCFQMFGFDVVLDGKLEPWLLECNMSPACQMRGELKDVVKQMTQGMLGILGFIEHANTQNWRPLHNPKHSQLYTKQPASCRIFRQTCQNFSNRASLMKMKTTMNTISSCNDFAPYSKKLDWKKYRTVEKYHYYVEKILIIQRYVKIKFKSSSTSTHNKPSTKCLALVEQLSKIVKKSKKNLLLHLKSILNPPKPRLPKRPKQNLISTITTTTNKFRISF